MDSSLWARPTFLAVMLVVMQHKATAALAHVGTEGIEALMLAPTVVLGALIFVCGKAERGLGGQQGRTGPEGLGNVTTLLCMSCP